MIYLLLSILASSVIFLVFKLFDLFKINTFQAIVVNYAIACAAGIIGYAKPINLIDLPNYSWFGGTVFLGFLFILIFNLMAITTQRSGLSVVSVSTKMSVVIPIAFGLLYYNENAGLLKISGIILALIAVYLVSVKDNTSKLVSKNELLFPILVFLGSGIIDTTIKYLETSYVEQDDISLFSAVIFLTAFVIGISILIFKVLRQNEKIKFKNLVGGLALGIPNYYSIYFLVKALRNPQLESSVVFTLNNVGILICAVLLGILFFREKLSRKNWLGFFLALISIICIAIVKS
ncbi:EamA family transporter [Leeuwenhoekiella aequorea]|uniref:EamA-like transporter family protein n=1 Tax=Leeuwenhoekiella aequorea TaxID=283736 RepID=A0A4Q0P902_9FLAO|nr:EamA family transporter [Leeuwenhoekiella aequorea]RXG23220.1 EamA-like transporter family protein [Leeuwenhoekiella aequorea]